MKKQKRGISLIALAVTVLVMTILTTAVVVNFNNSNIIRQSKEMVTTTRFRELENAVSGIVSDYHLLEENDAGIRNISLKEYILQRLEDEYDLTEKEKTVIIIDDNGNISRNVEE